MPEHSRKSHPGTAAVLSFVYSGLGQIYNGQIAKGLWIVFFSTLALAVLIIGGVPVVLRITGNTFPPKILCFSTILFFAGLVFSCVLSIYSIYDAYKFAMKQ